MAQVLIVAPFSSLVPTIRQVITEKFSNCRDMFKIVVADLQDFSSSLTKEDTKDVDVIVSRGGSAAYLEEHSSFPVVKIQVTPADIMEAVVAAKLDKDTRIGLSGFDNMIYDYEYTANLLGICFEPYLLTDGTQAEARMREAKNAGIDIIIGDAISVKSAQSIGLPAQLISSGKHAVYQALMESVLIADVRRQEHHKSQILQTVINSARDGLVTVDENGIIVNFNPEAEIILHRTRLEAIGRHLREMFPLFIKKHSLEEGYLVEIYNKKYLVTSTQVKVRDHSSAVIYRLRNVTEVQRQEINVRKKLAEKGLVARYQLGDIIGESDACQKMKHKARRYALTDSTILITGESGTGKELVAQSIHNLSQRAHGPFVAINCAAIPENLLESELFGYVEGAFTGARKGGHRGVFELAHGGTLFLDEIGEMPIALQSRLLRVLQERQIMPLGGEALIPVDVRVIAATNQNLENMIAENTFRSDLYYRLNILHIHIPNLRERRSDIPSLTKALIKSMSYVNPNVRSISREAISLLEDRDWPGNIRQLVNMIERVMLLADGQEITKDSILSAYEDDQEDYRDGPIASAMAYQPQQSSDYISRLGTPGTEKLSSMSVTSNIKQAELNRILSVLQEEGFNYSRAAKRLGMHRTTLWRKIKNFSNKSQ